MSLLLARRIECLLKKVNGTAYTITRPRDMLSAWADVASRIVKAKSGTLISAAGFR